MYTNNCHWIEKKSIKAVGGISILSNVLNPLFKAIIGSSKSSHCKHGLVELKLAST
ncbi:MAG: hypothetical protein IPP29_21140 [Bacteroidetes bacterium]|nr:hypothetical protein [Bacteroidota bacterium]